MKNNIRENQKYFIENKISILSPTHNRPKQLSKMISSALDCSDSPELVEFCLYIDKDDFTYEKIIKNFNQNNLKIIRGPKAWLSFMYNSLLIVADGELLLYCGDDVEFRSSGWDSKIRKVFENSKDKLIVAHVNDGANYEQIWATVGVVHQNWVKLFGHIFTPHIPDNGIDAWITHIANKLNRRVFLNSVLIEHKQYRQGKSKLDITYKQRLLEHQKYHPLHLYKSLDEERQRDTLLLAKQLNQLPLKIEKSYMLAGLLIRILKILPREKLNENKIIFFGSMKNLTLIKYLLNKVGFPILPSRWY